MIEPPRQAFIGTVFKIDDGIFVAVKQVAVERIAGLMHNRCIRDLGIGIENATVVLVRQEIDFLRELRWPGEVTVGTALAALGRTSFTMAQVIFDGEHCAAMGRATMVMLDAATRKPRALTPEAIAKLEPWTYRGA